MYAMSANGVGFHVIGELSFIIVFKQRLDLRDALVDATRWSKGLSTMASMVPFTSLYYFCYSKIILFYNL